MNQYDVSGILMTYSEKAKNAKTTKQLKKIIKNLKSEFDLRTIKAEGAENNG